MLMQSHNSFNSLHARARADRSPRAASGQMSSRNRTWSFLRWSIWHPSSKDSLSEDALVSVTDRSCSTRRGDGKSTWCWSGGLIAELDRQPICWPPSRSGTSGCWLGFADRDGWEDSHRHEVRIGRSRFGEPEPADLFVRMPRIESESTARFSAVLASPPDTY